MRHPSVMILQPRDTILFQGDSITNAFRKPDEINNAYQLGAGYAFLVAARLLAARPADELTFLNRGVSGEGVPGLAARWETDCLALKPTVLSVLVGINDVVAAIRKPEGDAPARYETGYRELLQRTRAVLPGIRLVLCEPFALPCGVVTDECLTVLRPCQEAVARLAEEFAAVFVPLQGVFDAAVTAAPAAYWIYDGIHPTAQGQWLVAQAWLRAVGVDA